MDVEVDPVGVQKRTISHFKGLISAKVDLEAQGRDSTFTLCHALLKKAILHLKRAKGVFIFFWRLYVRKIQKLKYFLRCFAAMEGDSERFVYPRGKSHPLYLNSSIFEGYTIRSNQNR